MRKAKIIVVAIILMAALIGDAGLGYLSWKLTNERDQLSTALETEQHRFKLLKQKYAEQKTLAASIQRAKLGVEGRLAQAQQEMDSIKQEKEAIQEKIAGLEKQFEKKTASLEERLEKQSQKITRLKEIQEEYKTKLAEAVQVARERHAKILQLESDNGDLTARLQEKTSGLRRCEEHNVRLSQLSEEVVHAYYNKSTGSSVDPFTKIKQVELEKIVQEYLDRIDKDNMGLLNKRDE
ncbi:hypothetical protein [uncultured Desulfosarcina sp.]|uniref:hypothetical protein n=1 Tax=uncultured Desulfosarcina sp. TaxID=218289 RepID=UPI0029C65E09|nr:hypothetical protein [uncultured Desulfosarcina sp.]